MPLHQPEQIQLLSGVQGADERRDHDFYETYRWQTRALLERLNIGSSMLWLEPCAGNGAIAKMLREWPTARTEGWCNDLVQREYRLQSTLDMTLESSWQEIQRQMGRIDLVITNMPFVLMFPIMVLAYEYAQVGIATVARHSWDEPTNERSEWLAAHPLTAKFVMPRADYRKNGKSDMTPHSWFVWSKIGDSLVTRAHDVVSIAECQRYAAQYREKV